MKTYDVCIKEVATGEEVIYKQQIYDHHGDTMFKEDGEFKDFFWWTDGNMGCDCNRSMDFDRAKGIKIDDPLDENPRYKCGSDRFTIEKIICEGLEVWIDGEEAANG